MLRDPYKPTLRLSEKENHYQRFLLSGRFASLTTNNTDPTSEGTLRGDKMRKHRISKIDENGAAVIHDGQLHYSDKVKNGMDDNRNVLKVTKRTGHPHPHTLQSYYEMQRTQQHPHLQTRQHRFKQTNGTLPYNCTALPKTRHNRWIITESDQSGFGNQLFGVYSYLAAAFYYNSSLIIGDIYSRTSFDLVFPMPRSRWIGLPFSSFFDWYHFSSFWKVRGVDTIERRHYDHCPEPPDRLRPIPLIREPDFWPFRYVRRMKMLQYNNLTIPLPENIIMNLISPCHFVAFGFFFEFPALLLDVYQSLQPAPLIAKFIQLIQRELRNVTRDTEQVNPIDGQNRIPYIAAHLRIENDLHGANGSSQRRAIHEDAIKFMINNNTCLSQWPRDPHNYNRLLDPPPLYLACGLWGKRTDLQEVLDSFSNNSLTEKDLTSYSLQDFTLYLLYEAGFHTIYNQEIILFKLESAQMSYVHEREKREVETKADELILANADISSEAKALIKERIEKRKRDEERDQHLTQRFRDYIDYGEYHALFPEQLAMIDLYVSRYSPCFCHAHISSSFSYWVLRMKALAEGKHLHIWEVNEINYSIHNNFRNWGL